MNLFIGFIGGFIIVVILVMCDDINAIKSMQKIRQKNLFIIAVFQKALLT